MLHRIVLISVSLSLMWLQGCSTMNMMTREPVFERFYLHDGIKVGDTAVYYSPDQQRYRYQFKVVDRQGNVFEVVWRWIDGSLSVEKHFFVSADGRVQRAYIIETGSGERHPLRIEGVKPDGFYHEYSLQKFATPQDVIVDGKTYTVEYGRVYKIRATATGIMGNVEVVTVDLIDPSVPFGVVKSAQDISVEKSIVDYASVVIKAALPDIYSKRDVLNELINKIQQGDHKFKQHFVVQSYEQ